METTTIAAAMLLAERDGIHPAHAANRVDLACRIAEAIVAAGTGEATKVWGRDDTVESILSRGATETAMGNAVRSIVAKRAGACNGTVSLTTWSLAGEIAAALTAD